MAMVCTLLSAIQHELLSIGCPSSCWCSYCCSQPCCIWFQHASERRWSLRWWRVNWVSCSSTFAFSYITRVDLGYQYQNSPFWILLELRMMEVVVTAEVIRHAELQSNRHQQQTSTERFMVRMPFLSPTNGVEALKGKLLVLSDKNNLLTLTCHYRKKCTSVIYAARPLLLQTRRWGQQLFGGFLQCGHKCWWSLKENLRIAEAVCLTDQMPFLLTSEHF